MSKNIHFISAGAGSGKTYSLTKKLENLLSTGKVAPAGVIATTFTKLAAGELQERVRQALIEAGQPGIANQMEQSLIGTVNSVCGDLLRRFAFEAGMSPDQQVLDEAQGNILFFQAMEQALVSDKSLIRKMNATCQRLQIIDQRKKRLLWRQEVKKIVDAARANNQSADDIRNLGEESADQLLSHFPTPSKRDLNADLLGAVNHALVGTNTKHDSTKKTRDYLSFLKGVQAALVNRRLSWPEWISLSKKSPGNKSKDYAQPIVDIASDYSRHPDLHGDIRFFAEQVFRIAAVSLEAYQQLKVRKGLIDFVDQEQYLYQVLDNPTVAETLQEELQLLMVDEFQDTSPIQLALFLKLSQLADQVIWVGDIKQSIYGFRGSDPALMDAVVKRVIKEGSPPEILEKSWRSRPELVAYTNNLFVPAFADTLAPEQVRLEPARKNISSAPAVETWRMTGSNKGLRALALANGIRALMDSNREVVDKDTEKLRPLAFGDIAILCRTHENLSAVANALAEIRLPISYKRAGLLQTPEGCLALACLRRLVDPLDTLATAEIVTLTTCESPEEWGSQRMQYLEEASGHASSWLEDDPGKPIADLKKQRKRLPFLTPVEALQLALEAGKVRETVKRWGPTEQRSQHRLNNLAALQKHADEYLDQCRMQNEPATAVGLVLWFKVLTEAEEDTQASGSGENAIQLVTHHGAKGLEWPIVIAMDMCSVLKPRIWGLNVIASPDPISLDNPLANRTLRYWPKFTGQQSAGIPLLDQIEESDIGQAAMDKEIQESKRLLYVSMTRPRETLVMTMDNKNESGPWMDTLDADWMLPKESSLVLPDEVTIHTAYVELSEEEASYVLPKYTPTWLSYEEPKQEILPYKQSPSSFSPLEGASIGEVIEIGERLQVNGKYDPATLGSALHAVIAGRLLGQTATERVLTDYGVQEALSVESAEICSRRLINKLKEAFSPNTVYVEYPVQCPNEKGQLIAGWIDLLLETDKGFIIIDHKASPRSRSDWGEVATRYSGQLKAYADSILKITSKPVVSCWIHFAVTGGLVEVDISV